MKPCRITFLSFIWGEIYPGYTRDDLINGIDYAEHLIEEGFEKEPMDGFDLHGYIQWCKDQL
jgi:hypothetical protein